VSTLFNAVLKCLVVILAGIAVYVYLRLCGRSSIPRASPGWCAPRTRAARVNLFSAISTRPRSVRSPFPVASRYVDPKLCATCHPSQWETYRQTARKESRKN
jgi:hypothetical protein